MKKLYYFFLLTLLPFIISAQNKEKIDSLLQAYNKQPNDTSKVKTITALYNSLLYSDAKSAKKYAEEELSLSKKLKFEKELL